MKKKETKKIDPEKNRDYLGIDDMELQEGKYNKCTFYNNVYISEEVCKRKCKALVAYDNMLISRAKIPSCARDRKLEERFMSNKRKAS